MNNPIQDALNRFREYKVAEYGKWKIGRAEVESFLTEELHKIADFAVRGERERIINQLKVFGAEKIDEALLKMAQAIAFSENQKGE